ncbi:hypothetical protein BKE30_09670 [Alkanindiges hydrocarboniclasticus]|uniref:Uncharacterized protein n=1 Tax=Alkanindiges hydrocarboniclasticus TaxID=1907941 RepID=A0A1S8CV94_9GAMM|nr:hypothetical protein [Alkanindiges hydrocarboniclasticus]ONG39606.1 hypothetical protein BKE30_09670 [Alkanindiges hydrocarboniclasticus]
MTKLLLLCSVLFIGCIQSSYAQNQQKFIETVELNRKTNSLEFKDILKNIYAQQIGDTQQYASDEDFKSYPKTVFYDAAAQEQQLVLMHPVVVYKNANNEIRYFVLMEKLSYSNGYLETCRACSAKADFLIFKKQDNGSFYLLNYQLNADDLPGGAGRLKLDLKQIKQHLQPMGKDLIGSYFVGHYTGAGGEAGSEWYNLFLPDQGKIQVVDIGLAGNDSRSFYADRPEYSSVTTSTLNVMANGQVYYPIEVSYKTLNGGKKKSDFEKSRFIFNPKANAYIEQKIKR